MRSLVNLGPCQVCHAQPGEAHTARCRVPGQAVRAASHLARVETRLGDPEDLRHVLAAGEVRNLRAMRAWYGSGRPL